MNPQSPMHTHNPTIIRDKVWKLSVKRIEHVMRLYFSNQITGGTMLMIRQGYRRAIETHCSELANKNIGAIDSLLVNFMWQKDYGPWIYSNPKSDAQEALDAWNSISKLTPQRVLDHKIEPLIV